MRKHTLFQMLSLLCAGLSAPSLAGDRQWSFDEPTHPELSVLGGEVTGTPGVQKRSLVLDGASTLQVKDSAAATHQENGFTCAVWVNPYATENGQQMIAAKNRYSRNEREWGVMIDREGRIKLYLWQGKWVIVDSAHTPEPGHWQHVLVRITRTSADLWINGRRTRSAELEHPLAATEAPLTFGGVNDNGRIWQNLFGALDDARLFDRALSDAEAAALYHPVAAVHPIPEPPKPNLHELWSGPPIPNDPERIPFAEGIEHQTLLDARTHDYKFLHGAAIIHYKGTFFANWANSPKNENQQHETLQGRRSADGRTWSDVEMIGAGFEGAERHSHGVYLKHQGQLWTFPARFGKGTKGRRFTGLGAEAFALNEKTGTWESKGRVMDNCWPYDEPIKMEDGNYITGGQDRDGLPVVAISDGDNVLSWKSVLIPYPPKLAPSFAETSVWAEGKRVTAVIRGGANVAWVATSDDYGQTWAQARPSNLPMPRAKCYFGKLSTGQLYLLSNLKNRDTLCVSVGRPGETTLSSIRRIRHGRSIPPRFPGAAKSKQWSYPYGYEHDGKLYVVYSVGKEDCGLSIIPLSSLAGEAAEKKANKPVVKTKKETPAQAAARIARMEKIAEHALVPPVVNTSPLPEYGYDQLDYGMTIGIERTPGGRLWACWVAGGDSPDAFFVLASSDDYGETWSPPRAVLDSHEDGLGARRSILVGNLWTDPKGRLWLFFDQSMDMFDGRAGVWATVCANPDAAAPLWSKPRRIWHGVTLNKPTVLSTGEWMLPISLDQRPGFREFRGCFRALDPLRGANVFVSTDEGATWNRRGVRTFPNPDWHEHMIVEKKNGSLWMLARTRNGIMESESADGGRNWSEPIPSNIRHPVARFHIRRLASDRLLLVKHGATVDTHKGRSLLTAWLSDDEGATWQGGLTLDERTGVSYPDGFQAPDGSLYISWDRNRSTEGEILMARFTEEDILARAFTGPRSRTKMLISRPLAREGAKLPAPGVNR